ncbi:MAG: ATPase P [Chloroflexota bacterium]
MIKIDIPGFKTLKIEHLVLDYNGTIARDGSLIEGVGELFERLSPSLTIHVVTADTFGRAAGQLANLSCKLTILPKEDQAQAKVAYARQLGLESTICIGNGRNDRQMVKEAIVGIVLIQTEGAAVETMLNADIICRDILDALSLFTNPKRLVATLRQ